jgi:hypothetical protein
MFWHRRVIRCGRYHQRRYMAGKGFRSKSVQNFDGTELPDGRKLLAGLLPAAGPLQWNIMMPWNLVLTSSMSIFQTSCEHVLVALTVCAWRAL